MTPFVDGEVIGGEIGEETEVKSEVSTIEGIVLVVFVLTDEVNCGGFIIDVERLES